MSDKLQSRKKIFFGFSDGETLLYLYKNFKTLVEI